MDQWEQLRQQCMSCRACGLADTRTNVVFGVGDPRAEVLLVGEAPGASEDRQGEPFVGAAGKLLDDMLAMIGLRRQQIYITNSVKCRPPQNRDPLNIEQEASYNEEDKLLKIELKGEGLGLLIGRRGETLDSIQYLTNIFVNKKSDDYVKVTIDAENYRARREEALVSLAKRTASKAVKYRKNMIIEPKNPYERRIIHEALQDYPEVTTYSVGEDPNRKVIVAYKGMAGGYRKNQE